MHFWTNAVKHYRCCNYRSIYFFSIACGCHPAGTSGSLHECHPQTGNCQCLSHVTGRACSYCEVGFFNLQHGVGCERWSPLDMSKAFNHWGHEESVINDSPAFLRCQCNPIGSSSMACHPTTGQCVCHAGVEGRLCDSCRVGFFGFSSRGCRGTGLYLSHQVHYVSIP